MPFPTSFNRRLSAAIAALPLVLMLGSCKAAPLKRPVPTSPINTGPDSMTAVRERLAGEWVLVSMHVSTMDGRRQQVDAGGTLLAERFGALSIDYRISDAGLKALASLGITSPNPVVYTKGQVMIDPQQQQITYTSEDFQQRLAGFDPKLAAQRANPFALERVRYYAFGDDGTLTLTTRYDNGQDAIVSIWRKTS